MPQSVHSAQSHRLRLTVWIRLVKIARQTCRTLRQVKCQTLDDFLRQQLNNPIVRVKFAQHL